MTLASEFAEGLASSVQAILANKLRSALTALGIIIGIVTVSLMAMAIDGLRQSFLRSISVLGADIFYIEKFPWERTEAWWKIRNRRDFAVAEGRAILGESTHALAVSVEASTMQPVRYKDRSASSVWTAGNNEQGALVRQLNLREGRFFSEAEVRGARPVCVLGSEIHDRLFPEGGAIGERILVGGRSFEVVGVNEKFGATFFANMDNQVIVPITRFTSDFIAQPYLVFMVRVRDADRMGEAMEEMRGIVRKLRRVPPGAEDDFAINQQDMLVRQFERLRAIIASVGLFVTGLALFVGAVGIMNIMYVSVAERTREIGVRKAVGAKRRTILIQFLVEAALICVAGGLIGLGIAWGGSRAVRNFLPAAMSPQIAALAILVSLATGVAAGFLPAYRAARMRPVDALRDE